MFVATGASNGSKTLFCHTHEVMLCSCGTNRVNGNSQRAICTIFETNRKREAAGKLTVELRLGGSGADGTERNQVGQELRRDCVQHLAGNRHARAGEIDEQLPGDTEPFVDFEGLVNVRVVDQPLPAHRRAGLLEVGTHDDAEIGGQLGGDGGEAAGIFEGSDGIVDRTWSADDQKAVRLMGYDLNGISAPFEDCLEGMLRLGG